MKKILVAVVLSLAGSMSTTVNADTVFCVNCSNEAMDIMRQAQNLAQYTAQTSHMLSQLEILRRQAATLSGTSPSSQTNGVLTQVMSMVNQSKALGYNLQNIERDFQTKYPSYGDKQGNYFKQYQQWSDTTSASIQAALRASGLQMENFANEVATAETLRVMSQTAGGQMQAIQVGNAVSSELLDEMRKLRSMQAAQNQAQNAFLMGSQAQGDSTESQLQKMVSPKNAQVNSLEENAKLRKARTKNEKN